MQQAVADKERCDFEKFGEHDDGSAHVVVARLRRSGYSGLSGVECVAHEGVVELSGTVPSFYLKQVAQELAAHTAGVWHVVNCLRVPVAPRPK